MSATVELQLVERIAAWIAGSVAASVAVAWVAFQLQQDGVAPALLFPLGVGALAGAASGWLARGLRLRGRGWLAAAGLVWGLLTVIGQDYIGHKHHLRAFDEALAGQSPLAAGALASQRERLPDFAAYLAARIRAMPAWWAADLALTLVAAVGATYLTASNPTSGNMSRDQDVS